MITELLNAAGVTIHPPIMPVYLAMERVNRCSRNLLAPMKQFQRPKLLANSASLSTWGKWGAALFLLLASSVVAEDEIQVRDKAKALIYTVTVNGSKAVVRDRHGAVVSTKNPQHDGSVIVRDRKGAFVAKVKPLK